MKKVQIVIRVSKEDEDVTLSQTKQLSKEIADLITREGFVASIDMREGASVQKSNEPQQHVKVFPGSNATEVAANIESFLKTHQEVRIKHVKFWEGAVDTALFIFYESYDTKS